MATESIETRVLQALDSWLRWLPTWSPGTHRGRARLCRRCTGSPIVQAAGLGADVPHQVCHALTTRMQRIIDTTVDAYTKEHLPMLQAELEGEQLWKAGGYDPNAGLAAEYDGVDPDPIPDEGDQPFLFTIAELVESTKPEPALPRPPLRPEEKRQLASEIELADRCASQAGQEICFALVAQRERITAAIARFVEPQIQMLLDELSQHLEPPRN